MNFKLKRGGVLRVMVPVVNGLVLLAGLAGCSSGVLGNTGSTISAAKATQVSTLITDAPGDQVLALGLTVDSISLTDAAGNSTTILSQPVPVEVAHLDAVQEPLLPPLKIPQDTYVSATITVGAPTVVYVDPSTGKPVTATATLAAASTTVTFSSAITVGANSAPLSFDLLVGPSVAIAGTTVTVTPTWNVTQIALAQQPTNGMNGRVNGVLGKVVSVSGASFVVQTPNGQQVTLLTDSNTTLQGFSTLSALTAGELVDADVAQQPDGSLLALRIHLGAPAQQNLLVGPVTSATGSPVTSLTEVVRQPLGPGVSASSSTAATYTITIDNSTTFGLAPQAGPLPSLPFTPVFSSATLFAGQNVATVVTGLSGTAATAASVTLTPQTVDGAVASVTQSGGYTVYTVTLPGGSALGSLTGASSVVVYSGNGTQIMNSSSPAVGSQVRFNGLLFKDGSTLRLVAGQSSDAAPAPPVQRH